MFKSITLTIFVILMTTPVFSQVSKPCSLELQQAPELRTLRLGMTVSEASTALGRPLSPYDVRTEVSYIRATGQFPQNREGVNNLQMAEYNGNSRQFILGNKMVQLGGSGRLLDSLKDSLRANLGDLKLEFFRDRLELIHVDYSFQRPVWNDRTEIVRNISAKAGLPLNWRADERSFSSTIDCAGFSVKIYAFRYPNSDGVSSFSITLTDQKARQELDELAKQKWIENKAAEEKLKKEYVF